MAYDSITVNHSPTLQEDLIGPKRLCVGRTSFAQKKSLHTPWEVHEGYHIIHNNIRLLYKTVMAAIANNGGFV